MVRGEKVQPTEPGRTSSHLTRPEICPLLPATQLKPDEGTPELPEGRVRVRLQSDGSLRDVTDQEIEKVSGVCPSVCLP